jgi:hypothetical protein
MDFVDFVSNTQKTSAKVPKKQGVLVKNINFLRLGVEKRGGKPQKMGFLKFSS